MTDEAELGVGSVPGVIHATITLGVLFIPELFSIGRTGQSANLLPALVLYLPLAVAVVMFGGALLLRNRLFDNSPASVAAWWRKNLLRMVLFWALIGAPAFLAGMIYQSWPTWQLRIVVTIGFGLLLTLSPDKLRSQ